MDIDKEVVNDKFPEFRCQFTRNSMFDDDYELKESFFSYSRDHIDSYCFANSRIFLYRLAKQLADEGYIRPWYPDYDIIRMKTIINSYNKRNSHISKNFYHLALRSGLYDDVIAPHWTEKNLAFAILKLYKVGKPINRYNIIQTMKAKNYYKLRMGYIPYIYYHIKNNFGDCRVVNDIDDIWPDALNYILDNHSDNIVTISKRDNGSRPIIVMDELDIGEVIDLFYNVFNDEMEYATILK